MTIFFTNYDIFKISKWNCTQKNKKVNSYTHTDNRESNIPICRITTTSTRSLVIFICIVYTIYSYSTAKKQCSVFFYINSTQLASSLKIELMKCWVWSMFVLGDLECGVYSGTSKVLSIWQSLIPIYFYTSEVRIRILINYRNS